MLSLTGDTEACDLCTRTKIDKNRRSRGIHCIHFWLKRGCYSGARLPKTKEGDRVSDLGGRRLWRLYEGSDVHGHFFINFTLTIYHTTQHGQETRARGEAAEARGDEAREGGADNGDEAVCCVDTRTINEGYPDALQRKQATGG